MLTLARPQTDCNSLSRLKPLRHLFVSALPIPTQFPRHVEKPSPEGGQDLRTWTAADTVPIDEKSSRKDIVAVIHHTHTRFVVTRLNGLNLCTFFILTKP